MSIKKPVIALDCDGVLLDYNLAYAKVWSRFTRKSPKEIDPQAYWHTDRWNVRQLSGEHLAHFRAFFDADFWSSIPPIQGAAEACKRLHEHGYELVCVTALNKTLADARLKNLRDHGFPIEKVHAVDAGQSSPKKAIVHEINPVAFVDDFLPYFHGIDRGIHTALILREPNGSPNTGPGLDAVNSTHENLAAFAQWWLASSIQET